MSRWPSEALQGPCGLSAGAVQPLHRAEGVSAGSVQPLQRADGVSAASEQPLHRLAGVSAGGLQRILGFAVRRGGQGAAGVPSSTACEAESFQAQGGGLANRPGVVSIQAAVPVPGTCPVLFLRVPHGRIVALEEGPPVRRLGILSVEGWGHEMESEAEHVLRLASHFNGR